MLRWSLTPGIPGRLIWLPPLCWSFVEAVSKLVFRTLQCCSFHVLWKTLGLGPVQFSIRLFFSRRQVKWSQSSFPLNRSNGCVLPRGLSFMEVPELPLPYAHAVDWWTLSNFLSASPWLVSFKWCRISQAGGQKLVVIFRILMAPILW